MSLGRLPEDEHVIDALIDRELDALESSTDAGEFTRAIGALTELFASEHAEFEPMPSSVAQSCRDAIAAAEAGDATPGPAVGDTGRTDPIPFPTAQGTASTTAAPSAGVWAVAGWLAAAACLTLAVAAWWPNGGSVPGPVATPTLADRYIALAEQPGVVKTAWVGLDDVALTEAPHPLDRELSGEVIWDPETQTGFMKFSGLAVNEVDEFQYQLWIFDATRRTGDLPQFAIDGFPDLLTQRPVDGGVFDAASGEFIIPIDAKLPVGQAAIFAITKEPPGGVVVSDRDIVTLAVVQ